MADLAFTKQTFRYFDGARRHAQDRDWFDAHRAGYAAHVEVPFTHLVSELKERLAVLLPGVVFSPRKISKPLRRRAQDDEGPSSPLLRENTFVFLQEPATSMFETNPGLYVSLGATPEHNLRGCGLYMPSARQMKELRPRFATEAETLDRLLQADGLHTHWNGLSGGRYKRFPKDFDENAPGAAYLWHKQFFLSKPLTREDILHPEFIAHTVEAFAAAVPFLAWTRQAVGTYRKPKLFQDRDAF